MRFVYIGAAVAIVAIVVVLWGINWEKQRELEAAMATPTPAPAVSGVPTASPIPLQDGMSIGKPAIAMGPHKLPDTAKGGQGQPVDGVQCLAMEGLALHIHSHLAIFYHGKQIAVPAQVGIAPVGQAGCYYWLHTHDASGIIHIEAPQLTPPGGSAYTLGLFFDIWGQPLARDNVAGLRGPVTAYVNGERYDGDLQSLALRAHEQIVLEIGDPLVPPPNYVFPPND
jgi:hypothetical protein